MLIHWAIFGERNRGHVLLGASGNAEFANRIIQYTDRPGDPPAGMVWGPVDSAFHFSNYYVFLRILPDPTAGRPGMVRSYAAYVPVSELGKIPSLVEVFSKLPNSLVSFDASLPPLQINASANDETEDPPGLISISRELFDPNTKPPLIWASNEPSLPSIDSFWRRIPDSLRSHFNFAFQFAPEHKLPTVPTIVVTLPSLAGRWPSKKIISLQDSNIDDLTTAQRWFASATGSCDLQQILNEYGIALDDFGSLNVISIFAELIGRLPQLSFKEACRAVRILEKYSSKDRTPISAGKQRLFDKICGHLKSATPQEIAILRNLDSETLRDLIQTLEESIISWLDNILIFDQQTISLLETAIEADDGWWRNSFFTWLKKVCLLLDDAAPKAVCSLFGSDNLASVLSEMLAKKASIEENLVANLPAKLSSNCSKNLIALSVKNGWMELHATALARSTNELEAINTHALVAGSSVAGFQILEECFGFASLLRVACELGSENLTRYVRNSFIENIDSLSINSIVMNRRLFLILRDVICSSSGKIPNQLRSLIISILDDSSEQSEEANLCLSACLQRDISLIFELENPTSAIEHLNGEVKLEAIAKMEDCLFNRISKGEIIPLKFPLRLVNPNGVLEALKKVPIEKATEVGVSIFTQFPFLIEIILRSWLINLFTVTSIRHLNVEQCKKISELLTRHYYLPAAELIKDTVYAYRREDVRPILESMKSTYPMPQQQSPKPKEERMRLPKILIATALPLERTEVMKILGPSIYNNKLYADIATWPSEDPKFEIYVLTTGAGNLDAQSITLHALNKLKPKAAFFVGIAGGVKDSDVGDVIYSTKVGYYEGGKEQGGEIKARPSSEHSSRDLVQLAIRVADMPWQPPSEQNLLRKPKATPAVIASGEKVLASRGKKAATLNRIKQSFNDTQVIEMEAFGFMKACREKRVPHAMVVRGISDKIAGKANSDSQGNQPLAASNAVAFLFNVLAACSDLTGLTIKKKRK